MVAVPGKQVWRDLYAEGRGFRPVGEVERALLYELSTGLVVTGQFNFETLQVLAATTPPGYCRLTVPSGSELVTQEDAAAIVADGSLAYLTHVKISDGPEASHRRSEFRVHAYGPAGPEPAVRVATCVRTWDRGIRESGYPSLSVHPSARLPIGCRPAT